MHNRPCSQSPISMGRFLLLLYVATTQRTQDWLVGGRLHHSLHTIYQYHPQVINTSESFAFNKNFMSIHIIELANFLGIYKIACSSAYCAMTLKPSSIAPSSF